MKTTLDRDIICRKPTPIYQQLREEILSMLECGKLQNGSKLPTEQEFADRLGISRGTVRQAFQQLTEEGIVRKYPRRGSFISIDNLRSVMRVGVIAPRIDLICDDRNDFYTVKILGGMQEALMNSGAMLIPLPADLPPEKIAAYCLMRQVNGVIFLMSLRKDEELLTELRKALPLPLVVVAADPSENLSIVTGDDEYGSRLAAGHLLELGHRRIGAVFVSSDEYASCKRHKGFVEALPADALAQSLHCIRTIAPEVEVRFEAARRAVHEIMGAAEPPSALYAGGALILMGALRALRELELRIPEDVSLLGYDDFDLAEYHTPSLSVIAQPIWQIGRYGIELLLERIERNDNRIIKERLKPHLIARESTAIHIEREK